MASMPEVMVNVVLAEATITNLSVSNSPIYYVWLKRNQAGYLVEAVMVPAKLIGPETYLGDGHYQILADDGKVAKIPVAHLMPLTIFQPMPVKATLLPTSLRLNVGNLEVTAGQDGQGGFMAGNGVDVRLNGQPFPVRRLVVNVAMDEVVTVDAEFFPEAVAKKESKQQEGATSRNLATDEPKKKSSSDNPFYQETP